MINFLKKKRTNNSHKNQTTQSFFSDYELKIMKTKKNEKMEYYIYIICLLSIFIATLSIIILKLTHFEPTDIGIPCAFYEYLHIYCPGCGGTRAFTQMIHGHFIKSLMFHPFVLYATYLILYFTTRYTIYLLSKKKIKKMKFKESYALFGVGLIFIQWIVKNILLLVFNCPMPK